MNDICAKATIIAQRSQQLKYKKKKKHRNVEKHSTNRTCSLISIEIRGICMQKQ